MCLGRLLDKWTWLENYPQEYILRKQLIENEIMQYVVFRWGQVVYRPLNWFKCYNSYRTARLMELDELDC